MHRRRWVWDERKRLAARLLANIGGSQGEVAAVVGVSRQTLYAWRQTMEFAQRYNQILGRYAGRLRRERLARIRADMERIYGLQKDTNLHPKSSENLTSAPDPAPEPPRAKPRRRAKSNQGRPVAV